MMYYLFVSLLLSLFVINSETQCIHPIYCQGPVLKAIQESGIFNDSKTFIDLPLRAPPQEVLQAFSVLPLNSSLVDFVNKYFYPVNSDLIPVVPIDWDPNPPMFNKITDSKQLELAKFINSQWVHLVRSFDDKFCDGCYSHISVKYPFVIAGSRFREFYYWDTYWALNGLLISDMVNTSRGILRNLYDMVNRFGFVPNGGRIYYLNRSQPPLLTQMVNLYWQYTKDITAIKEAIQYLDTEYNYWMTKHIVDVGGIVLNRYFTNNTLPRPESYMADTTTTAGLSEAAKTYFYQQVATAAESGWDFSSRWMANTSLLASLHTTDIIPVDLNSIMYSNEIIMSEFHKLLGNTEQVQKYSQAAKSRLANMQTLMYNATSSLFQDYDLANKSQNNELYASVFVPLWAGLYDTAPTSVIDRFLKSVTPLMAFPAGVPASLIDNGQQWDFPNGWAPLQYYAVEGLLTLASKSSNSSETKQSASQLATQSANKWLTTNYCAYKRYNTMLEKYDITEVGSEGHGGEYAVQNGFGWTNGVALRFMELYANQFKLGNCPQIQ